MKKVISCSLVVFLILSACSKKKRYATWIHVDSVSATKFSISSEPLKRGFKSIDEKGVCYSADKIPVYGDNNVSKGSGKGLFTAVITGLKANTVYYARAYSKISDGTVFYSELETITTNGQYDVGDIGPAGGTIYYNYGTYNANRGKYCEVVETSGAGTAWGCNGVESEDANGYNINHTRNNTASIVKQCNDVQCAANYCNDYSFNGFSDWQLPVSDDYHEIYELSKKGTVQFAKIKYWTGTQNSKDMAYTFDLNTGLAKAESKNSVLKVLAVRSFD